MGVTTLPNKELICRICMHSDGALLNIFAQPASEQQPCLADMLRQCHDYEVKCEDALPQQICASCSLAVHSAYRFKLQCEQSYRQFCQLLHKSKIKLCHKQRHLNCPLCECQFTLRQLFDLHLTVHATDKQQLSAETGSVAAAADEADSRSTCSEIICEMPIEPAAYEELESEDRLADSDGEVAVDEQTEQEMSELVEVLLCDDATKLQSDVAAVSTHSAAAPRRAKTHHCKLCERYFTSRLYLQRHLCLQERKRFACKECGTSYCTRDELAAHIKQQGHDKPLLCPECGLRCRTSHTLMVHMRRHNGEKPYQCKFCSKGFPRMDDLRVHEKYHTGEKSHFCDICGKGFLRKYNLTIHMRVHTGERPYKCPHCPQAFSQGNDLKAHIRRHTGERFRCEHCHATFLQHYKIRQHKLQQHGIKEDARTQRLAKFTSPEEQQQQIQRNSEQQQHTISVESKHTKLEQAQQSTLNVSTAS